MAEDLAREIFKNTRNIAVVGLSGDPSKPSFQVSRYLEAKGFRIFPVNPAIEEWSGRPAYTGIGDIPEPIDLVIVFRRPERALQFIAQAADAGAKAVWLQEGVGSPEAKRMADERHITIVMDRCAMKEHRRIEAE